VKNQREIAGELERVDPSFDAAGFVSKNSSALPDRTKKFPSANRAS